MNIFGLQLSEIQWDSLSLTMQSWATKTWQLSLKTAPVSTLQFTAGVGLFVFSSAGIVNIKQFLYHPILMMRSSSSTGTYFRLLSSTLVTASSITNLLSSSYYLLFIQSKLESKDRQLFREQFISILLLIVASETLLPLTFYFPRYKLVSMFPLLQYTIKWLYIDTLTWDTILIPLLFESSFLYGLVSCGKAYLFSQCVSTVRIWVHDFIYGQNKKKKDADDNVLEKKNEVIFVSATPSADGSNDAKSE